MVSRAEGEGSRGILTHPAQSKGEPERMEGMGSRSCSGWVWAQGGVLTPPRSRELRGSRCSQGPGEVTQAETELGRQGLASPG